MEDVETISFSSSKKCFASVSCGMIKEWVQVLIHVELYTKFDCGT